MSMISDLCEQLKRLEDSMIKATRAGRGFFVIPPELTILEEAIRTIKILSVKLHAAQMERSSQYYNGGWIPCGERLPENKINPITCDGYMYPITYKNGDVTDTRYYTFVNGHWYHGAGIMDEYVIAWAQRPEPYQSKESEE